MEAISIFDIIKIGIGPSSSHTMGPWKAALICLELLEKDNLLKEVQTVHVQLYGSLAKTGRGHGTDVAVIMGLCGEQIETVDTATIMEKIDRIKENKQIALNKKQTISFNPLTDIVFNKNKTLEAHPNGMTFEIWLNDGGFIRKSYFSIGGGFVMDEQGNQIADNNPVLNNTPFLLNTESDVLYYCQREKSRFSELVRKNERAWRTDEQINKDLTTIWQTIKATVYKGCYTEGVLPGGLNVIRRAAGINKAKTGNKSYSNPNEWLEQIRNGEKTFKDITRWVTCFALAVNEENAGFGRIVTAPTNGAAGVIPAVLLYAYCFCENTGKKEMMDFLLTAGQIGVLFKQGATISAAMGGCQAEIGVSSAMAAAGLTECLGGTVQQAMMAAEIAMEHHLGLTCDPIAGLVQIPCIERNAMGAMKAITACQLAMEGNPYHARVSLDAVIKSMWETALDMNEKYKETSEGGLAISIPVNVAEC